MSNLFRVLKDLFGLGITPLREKLTIALNMSSKTGFIALVCLFLVSCGSLANLGEKVEPENTTQERIEKETKNAESTVPKLAEDEPENEAPTILTEEEEEVQPLQVHFIDVGQGDATLVISGEHAMLIDAGDDSKGTKVQLYLKNQGVEKLDYLVLTHTDADHIGGADVIISKFDIGGVFIGDFPKDNNVYRDLMQALQDKGLAYAIPEVGDIYALGDAFFMIVAPNQTYVVPNNSSIALVLQNGQNRFLFTGDAEAEAEADILANGLNIDCDVLKAGHHGSRYSNTERLLAAASPMYAVFSCAEGNSYGHPHAEVLNNLRAMGVKVFRTDEQGSVMAISNGTDITWNCVPTESWKAGESTQNSSENENNENTNSFEGQTSETEIVPEPELQPSVTTGNYAVNGRNGKIHVVGACTATGTGDGAMTNPVYFDTYEEAEAYSIQIAPGQDKRKCGNCYR